MPGYLFVPSFSDLLKRNVSIWVHNPCRRGYVSAMAFRNSGIKPDKKPGRELPRQRGKELHNIRVLRCRVVSVLCRGVLPGDHVDTAPSRTNVTATAMSRIRGTTLMRGRTIIEAAGAPLPSSLLPGPRLSTDAARENSFGCHMGLCSPRRTASIRSCSKEPVFGAG